MHLRHGEVILRNIKRHKTPYVLQLAKVALIAIPLYFLLFYFMRSVSGEWIFIAALALSIFVGMVIAAISFDYLFDKLVITNRRVVWINWKSPFSREEHEAELLDIQDIETAEKGILSKLPFFDYGLIEIETASSKVCIHYTDCPDTAGVKHFIIDQMEKSRGGIHEKREEPKEEWSVN